MIRGFMSEVKKKFFFEQISYIFLGAVKIYLYLL